MEWFLRPMTWSLFLMACYHFCCFNFGFINIWLCLSPPTILLPCLSNDTCIETNTDFVSESEPLVHLSVCDWGVEYRNNSTPLFYRMVKGKEGLYYLGIIYKPKLSCIDWSRWTEAGIFLHSTLCALFVVSVSVGGVPRSEMCFS